MFFFVTISGLLKWQQRCSTLAWSSSNCTKRFASYMWGKVCAWENTQTPLHMDMHFKALGLTGIINPAGSWSQRPMLLVYKKMSHRKKTKQTTSIRILVKGVRFLLTFVSTRFWLMCAMIFAATVPWRVCVCVHVHVRACALLICGASFECKTRYESLLVANKDPIHATGIHSGTRMQWNKWKVTSRAIDNTHQLDMLLKLYVAVPSLFEKTKCSLTLRYSS